MNLPHPGVLSHAIRRLSNCGSDLCVDSFISFRARCVRPWTLAALVGVLSLAVAVVGLWIPVTPAAASVQAADDPVLGPGDLDDRPGRPDAVSASVTARTSGVAVEDISQRSESERVFANPDGSWTSETASEPTQVQDGASGSDGTAQWNLVDPTLVEVPGTAAGWRPAHAVVEQSFTAGGTDWFASLTQAGHELRFGLDGDLAAGGTDAGTGDGSPVQFGTPVVSENTAVYKNVASDEAWSADLVVRASAIGFEHWWVLNPVQTTAQKSTAPSAGAAEEGAALAAASITDLDLGLTVTDVTAQKSSKVDPVEVVTTDSGGIKILTGKGTSVLQAPGPLYWDATTTGPDEFDPAAKALKTRGKKPPKRTTPPGEPADEGHVHKAKTSARNLSKNGKATGVSVIRLGIPADVLKSAAAAGPVTVDPSFTVDPNADTWIQTPDYTTSQVTSQELRVGTNDNGGHKARSYLKFDDGNSKWAGKHVTSASMKLRNFYSGSCTGSAIRASRLTSNWDLSGLTWGNQPNGATTNYTDMSTARGFSSSCPAADVSFNLTSMVQAWASGTKNYGLRLMAVNEDVNSSWRRYRSANFTDTSLAPTLSVTYNSYPGTAGTPVVSPGTAPYATSLTPKVCFTVSDTDAGAKLRGSVEVYAGSTASGTALWSWTATDANAVSTGTNVCPTIAAGKLTNGSTYTVRARAFDGTDWSKSYSASKTFTVDTAKPNVTVTASSFTNGQWRTDRPASNTFNFNGPTDTKSFSVVRDGGAATMLTANSSGDASLSWVPANGSHMLKVTATDKAGNTYTPDDFTFGVGSAGFVLPNKDTRSTGVFPVSAEGPPGAEGASVSWRYTSTSTTTPEWNTADDVTKGSGEWDGAVTSDSASSATGTLNWDASAQADPAAGTEADPVEIKAPSHIELRVCFSYPSGAAEACTPAQPVELVPSAFGDNFPTTDLGPASVALLTGEVAFSETDAVDTLAGVGRTFSSYDAATSSPGEFGLGWSTELLSEGDSDAYLVDNRAKDATFVLVTAGNASQTYTPADNSVDVVNPTGPVTFVPTGGEDGSRLVLSPASAQAPSSVVVTRPQQVSTTWTWKRPDATDTTPGTEPEEWVLVKANGGGTASFSGSVDGTTWIGQTEAGAAATCTPVQQTSGCRWLQISYTGADDAKRVTKIERGIAGTTGLTTLATYSYNAAGQLVDVCGPDPDGAGAKTALCASYDYTTVGGRTLLVSAAAPGQKPWKFDYDSTGRLTSVSRPLDPANVTSNTTEAIWTIAYGLTTSTAGLPDMSTAATSKWGQDTAPAKVYAVFGPERVPSSTPSTADLSYASLYYTDATGQTVNTAKHGNVTHDGSGDGEWLVDTTWYDNAGNTHRTLDAAGRAQALAASTDPAVTSQVAFDASAFTVYGPVPKVAGGSEGSDEGLGDRVLDEYGPAHTATLEDGSIGQYRSHSHYVYDDQAPELGGDDKPALPEGQATFNLVVEQSDSAASADMSADYDITLTRNIYDPVVAGDGSGWKLSSPTKIKTRTGSDSTGAPTWSTQITRHDSDGRRIESRQPGGAANADGSGADAHATVFSYYAKNSTDPDCGVTGHPERAGWESQLCKSGPAAQPDTTDAPTMPVTHYAAYDEALQPTRVTESSGATTRTTTISYDLLGRSQTTTTTTQGGGIEADSRSMTTGYDPKTGMPTTQSNTDGAITTTYDTWGRVSTYTDSLGNTSTTSYTVDGQIASFNDSAGTYTYTYDGPSGEHRRVATTVHAGILKADGTSAAPFKLSYDAADRTAQISYPGGTTAVYTRDQAGAITGLEYTNGDGSDLLEFTNTLDVDGRVVESTSPESTRAYTYDALGRLTKTEDTRADGCISRVYGFSATSERTGLATYAPATGTDTDGDGELDSGIGRCQTTTAKSTDTTTYDTASRIRDAGYTYDALGRTQTVPAADTSNGSDVSVSPLSVTYYANDMAKSLTQTVQTAGTDTDGDGVTDTGPTQVAKTTRYGLDPTGRINTITNTTAGAETSREQFVFAAGGDSPRVVRTSTNAGTNWSTTRYVSIGTAGMVASITDATATLNLANLHGDTVATVGLAEPGVSSYGETDEFGNAVPSSSNPDSRYGYLGASQRAPTNLGGLTLMGARLYNPISGSFLSVDKVLGGNATAYTYPADPVNSSDTSGLFAGVDDGVALLLAIFTVTAGLIMLTWYLLRNCTFGCNVKVRSFSIPFPNPFARSAWKYHGTRYLVYRIYNVSSGRTYKYGISRQGGSSRPASQLPKCARYYGSKCDWSAKFYVRGWYHARMAEAGLIWKYAMRHGHCPPGQYFSCI
ncbi:DNRLRE domain-containing protein [Nocardioides sp. NBC_00163]|uniref:DNRLRE domain-containing protein n=1 Tax=Nocardioides sp. NBC_00163 TaxID=2975999 RepID=UPI00324C64F2